jgi:hypothetical protein
MADIKQMWRERAAKKLQLDKQFPGGCCFITSESDPQQNSIAGVTSEVSTEIAARMLLARTAHLSNEAEIAKFKEDGRRFSELHAGKTLQHHELTPIISALTKR